MTTILFHYLHRDEGNWKDHLEAVVDNPNNLPLDEIESRIKRALIDGEYFYHRGIGLVPSEYAESGDWHEFDGIEETRSRTDFVFTVDELLERLEKVKPTPQVHKIPRFIPIRLAVAWLEFLRETRQSIEIITHACRGRKTMMVFNDGDWEILSETLELDARSGSFDKELRKDILCALDRAVTIEVAPMKELRYKIRLLEGKIQKELGKNKAA